MQNYNGSEEMADREEYELSGQYKLQVEEPALELKVIVLNINAGRNRELMEKCQKLRAGRGSENPGGWSS
ncbi:MAG: hypothetical protein E7294_01925 [Lachnospiraceae bacterium]|jgi:hypothetical protein|nr:hypothetical protein [Lachnospiraceae bacterium]